MFRTFFICALLLIVLALAPHIASHHGSITVIYGEYSYGVPLLTFLLALIVLLVALSLLEVVFKFLFRILFGWWTNRKVRREAKSAKYAKQALSKAVEGDYQKASRLFQRSANLAEKPFNALALSTEYALANNDQDLAKELLDSCAEKINDDAENQKLFNVLKLKYFQVAKEWEAGRDYAHSVLESTNTEEVRRLALTMYLNSHAWGKLEDLIPKLLKHKTIDAERAQELRYEVENGYISQQAEAGAENLFTWWDNQLRSRRFNLVARLVYLRQIMKMEGKNNTVIAFAVETLRAINIKDLEDTNIKGLNFLDLISDIEFDDLNFSLSRALEKNFNKFTTGAQDKVAAILANLYFRAQKFPMAKTWVEKLLASTSPQAQSPENMLLAQVLYRQIGDSDKLLGLENRIDQEYLQGPLHSDKEKAEEAVKAEAKDAKDKDAKDKDANAKDSKEAKDADQEKATEAKDAKAADAKTDVKAEAKAD